MRGRREERIEAAIDHLAAAALGCAMAYALMRLLDVQLVLCALAAGLTYGAAARLLRSVEPHRRQFDFPVFRIADLELADAGELLLTDRLELTNSSELLLTEQVELVLTDADRLSPRRDSSSGELVLDDILAELGPQSRVVRLFDPNAATPAHLNARIERHLRGSDADAATGDATEALHHALAELRRSLR